MSRTVFVLGSHRPGAPLHRVVPLARSAVMSVDPSATIMSAANLDEDSNFIQSLNNALTLADGVIAVLDEPWSHNVSYELGIAQGRHVPTLILADSIGPDAV